MSQIAGVGLLLIAFLHAGYASAVSVGQIDTFEDGTIMGWTMGPNRTGSPVSNVASGGPGGAGDNFLQVVSGSNGFPRLTVFNDDARWLGDYVAANITAITMDLRNLGATDVSIRIALRGGLGSFAMTALSNAAVQLPAGGAWTKARFSVQPADLIFEDGATASLLSNPVDLRIFHAVNGAYPGGVITASLGIDNVQAVPEPGLAVQLIAGTALVCGWAALRRRRSA